VFTALYQGQENVTGGIPMPWSQLYALVTFVLWFAATVSERGPSVKELGLPDPVARAADGLGRLAGLFSLLFVGFYWYLYLAGLLDGTAETPYPAIFPLVIALIGWRHQANHREALCRWLSKCTFPKATQPPLPAGLPYDDLVHSISREQQAPATLYDLERPFIGMGTRRQSWSFAMELCKVSDGRGDRVPAQSDGAGRSAADGGSGGGLARRATERLTARAALDMIEPQLVELRESAGLTGRDRLRDLEIERFVYLPGGVGRDEALEVGGVDDAATFTTTSTGPGRSGHPVYDPAQIDAHMFVCV
jgi:hypothetical protein